METARAVGDDDVLAAIEDLTESVDAIADIRDDARRGSAQLREARRTSASWTDVVSSDHHREFLDRVNRLVGRVSDSASRLRRSLIVALRGEGLTVEQIGRHFGVSHQRISSVLRAAGRQRGNSGGQGPAGGPAAAEDGPGSQEAPVSAGVPVSRNGPAHGAPIGRDRPADDLPADDRSGGVPDAADPSPAG